VPIALTPDPPALPLLFGSLTSTGRGTPLAQPPPLSSWWYPSHTSTINDQVPTLMLMPTSTLITRTQIWNSTDTRSPAFSYPPVCPGNRTEWAQASTRTWASAGAETQTQAPTTTTTTTSQPPPPAPSLPPPTTPTSTHSHTKASVPGS